MEKKKSIGIVIIGWIFVIYGFLGLLGSLLFSQSFWKNYLWIKFANLSFRIYPTYINSGWESCFKIIFDKLFSEHPALLISYFFLIPILFFIIFLGGIGILRLENKWRRVTIYTFIILMFTKFVFEIYLKSYIFMALIMGKLINPSSKEVVSEIEEKILMLPRIIVQDLLIKILLISIVIFYLSRSKVKEQFYRLAD
jgi:hypothetical protein